MEIEASDVEDEVPRFGDADLQPPSDDEALHEADDDELSMHTSTAELMLGSSIEIVVDRRDTKSDRWVLLPAINHRRS